MAITAITWQRLCMPTLDFAVLTSPVADPLIAHWVVCVQTGHASCPLLTWENHLRSLATTDLGDSTRQTALIVVKWIGFWPRCCGMPAPSVSRCSSGSTSLMSSSSIDTRTSEHWRRRSSCGFEPARSHATQPPFHLYVFVEHNLKMSHTN